MKVTPSPSSARTKTALHLRSFPSSAGGYLATLAAIFLISLSDSRGVHAVVDKPQSTRVEGPALLCNQVKSTNFPVIRP
jgi:hypothetical protein